MNLNDGWTGRTASALQAALRLTHEAFAEHLGVGVRTVASWHQKPDLRPKSEMQQLLDTALDRAAPAVKDRFAALINESPLDLPEGAAADAEIRLSADPTIVAALDWLDEHANWQPGTARREVAARLVRLDVPALHDRGVRRGRVNQRDTARALSAYYGEPPDAHGRYTARFGTVEASTTVLTRPDWLDLDCPLLPSNDRLRLTGVTPGDDLTMDEETAGRAAQRLAEALALGNRMVNMPLFRLLDVDVRKRSIAGSVGVTSFVGYAVTMDLLEGELVDALTTGQPTTCGTLPLRDAYLPDLSTALDVSNRMCAGGALALTAIARPADPFRGGPDYLLLVQERSGHVINAARRLAVIPKGFHQPLTDFRADAQIGATLRREMEEELFGREDIDNTVGEQRHADPMHPSRLSDPMRWLTAEPGRLRMECTGFGLNLVSGNFEFASLIVIEDEEFWTRYGGQVRANWESSNLRQYSSLDAELLEELANDVAWSNEGLFALLQGLRRLQEIGGDRINLPTVEWEIK
ncbi:transcriptional regulator [Saccharothrix algeriensis]|uniref:Transcriptional regulator with XRE-family HTH domain n=1 Tax=Saccharothrix algeriensis TaxID=173560 RepID=A0ABS2SGH8_9PSEU|nr:transcriptional regulator [Saccharothrix algeriensis]MBM7814388.1 transcriptional regulator with XRE-family HTH domain [Saccharothrix algeriensis]